MTTVPTSRTTGPWFGLRGGHRVRRSRRWEMNSGLLSDGRHALLVDPGLSPSEISETLAAVPAGAECLVVFTHHHWDHVLARPYLPAHARTLAHERFEALLAADVDKARGEAEALAAELGESWSAAHAAFAPDQKVVDGDCVQFGPWTLDVCHVPGHSADAIAVLVREAGALFAGDLLSDVEPPSLNEPPAVYRDSLARLKPWVESNAAEVLVPGHGTFGRGRRAMLARFDADLAYLDAVESSVDESRAAGRTIEETTKALESLRYPGGSGKPYSTAEWHRANVRLVWESRAKD